MMGLNAWQLILWIICIEALSVPIIAILVNTIVICYYNTKTKFLKGIIGAFGKTLEQAVQNMGKGEKKDGQV